MIVAADRWLTKPHTVTPVEYLQLPNRDNLSGGLTIGDEIEYEGNRHSQVSNAGLTGHDLWIKCDAIESQHDFTYRRNATNIAEQLFSL